MDPVISLNDRLIISFVWRECFCDFMVYICIEDYGTFVAEIFGLF